MLRPDSAASRQRTTSTDYQHPHRPLPVTLANRAGEPLARLLRAPERLLDAGALIAAARRSTGLASFGPASGESSEQALRAPLERLLGSLRAEARLHPLGLLMVRHNLLRILANRLRLARAFADEPRLPARPAEAPLLIVGLQRTGTTLLHRLLAQDEGLRVLRSWEAINPAPLPAPPAWRALPRRLSAGNGTDRSREDPRVAAAAFAERALRYLAPDFFAIHPVQAHAPEEDCLLLDYTFYSTVFEATLRVPGFSAWLEGQDHRAAYRYYARILALLQQQRGADARWLLKTPAHMEQLDVLLETFPGAQVIQTHRDPQKVLASFCSMIAHGHGVFSDAVDPREVGAHWQAKQRRMVDRCLEVRARSGVDARFVDVAYAELVADPLAEARRIYRALGRPLSQQTERRMHAFLARNPKNRHGRHRYRLQDFGLDPQTVARGFAAYRRRFDIAAE